MKKNDPLMRKIRANLEKRATLREKAAKRYLQAKGGKCPYCGSNQVEGYSLEVDGPHVSQKAKCLFCKGEWIDYYKLCGVDLTVGEVMP